MSKHECMMAWVSLVHAGTYLPAALNQHLKSGLDISLAEQDFLKQLGASKGKLKMVELAKRIYFSKAAITKIVDRLESAGLVARVPCEIDRRVIYIELTGAGEALLARSKELLTSWVENNLCKHLSDSQIKSLAESLELLIRGHNRWDDQIDHLKGGAPRTES